VVRDVSDRPLFEAGVAHWVESDTAALTELVRYLPPNAKVVEVGSWVGLGSTQVFIRELPHTARLTCVDNWRGNPGVEYLETAGRDYDIFKTFRRNTESAANLSVMSLDSVEAAATFADRSLDLVFIDGDHRYSAVKADIAAWLAKVRADGILCGHDCERRVLDVADRARLRTVAEADSGEGVHAGVVLAVDEAFAGRARLFSEHSDSARPSTIWYVMC
jgi:predicted O-methyltransferase YrrM